MATKILVYPHQGLFFNGYQCEHAAVEPKNEGDVVLCVECSDAVDAGAKIVKRKEQSVRS
jgi:hypothetical protein